MSLTSAISNALSGMRAASAAADVAGNNLANATNENFVRRELIIQANSNSGGGGVDIVGVRRHSDPVMTAAWRDANGQSSLASLQTEYAGSVQALYGTPEEPGSLSNRVIALQESLVSATSRPDLVDRLASSVQSLQDLSNTVNRISDGIQTQRLRSEGQISRIADRMNDVLSNVETLNRRISEAQSRGNPTGAIEDQRDTLIDELSTMTDIRIFERERGMIAIYASGGAVLVDGDAAEISFDASSTMTADLTVASGHLGRLMINGEAVDVGLNSGKLRGGELAAHFNFRDSVSVEEQSEIDAFAFELATRLNDTSIDPTRLPSDPGFLTDASGIVDGTAIVGLAGRLSVNSALTAPSTGDAKRLRDGLLAVGATAGNTDVLRGLTSALADDQPVTQGYLAGTAIGLDDLAARLSTRSATQFTRLQDTQIFLSSQAEALKAYKLETAVDSDAELQNLMRLEQAYAANAQVLRSIDEMMDALLGAV